MGRVEQSRCADAEGGIRRRRQRSGAHAARSDRRSAVPGEPRGRGDSGCGEQCRPSDQPVYRGFSFPEVFGFGSDESGGLHGAQNLRARLG